MLTDSLFNGSSGTPALGSSKRWRRGGDSVALARKGSRRIIVGDVEFRWKVRGRPTYCQAMGWSPLCFAVQQADGQGARLLVSVPCAHPSNDLGFPAGAVLPRTVATAIKAAMEQGWQPLRPGPEFRLEVDASIVLGIDA